MSTTLNINKDNNNGNNKINTISDKNVIQLVKDHRTALAAGSSGIISVLVGHPFDTLKTRMQVADPPISLKECYRDMVKRHGYLSLWRGVSGPLCVVSFLKGFSFTNYDMASRTLMYKFYNKEAKNKWELPNVDWPQLPHYSQYELPFYKKLPLLLLSGSFAGCLTVMISGPLELIKVQVQLGRRQTSLNNEVSKKSENILSCATRIYKQKGVLGFYNGLVAHLIRDGFGTAIYFGGYESFKTLLSQTNQLSFGFTSLIAGGLAGTLSWCLLFPIDVVKSRLQKEAFLPKEYQKFNGSIIQCVKTLYRSQQGVKVFYAGLPPTLLRALPIHALNFTVYENALRWIDELKI